jgi:hypothetical protein
VTRYRLDSQFHCSYLESRGVPGKTREIWVKKTKKSAGTTGFRFTTSGSGYVISGDAISGDATSGDVISGDATSSVHTAPAQIGLELCPYTTFLKPSELQGGFVPLGPLLGLCPGPAGDLKRSADPSPTHAPPNHKSWIRPWPCHIERFSLATHRVQFIFQDTYKVTNHWMVYNI